MEKEIKEIKEKAINEYKSSEDFLNDIVKGSLSTFHNGFRDCKNKMKKIFPYLNVALLILSIANPVEQEAREAQVDTNVPFKAPPSAIPEAIPIAKVPSNTKHLRRFSLKLH